MLVELMMFFELFCCRFEEFARGSDLNILEGSNLYQVLLDATINFWGEGGVLQS